MSEAYGQITLEKTGRTAILTLDRPEARNAVTARMASEVLLAMADIEADRDILVGVLAGAGPAFCAGMDLAEHLDGKGVDICLGPELPKKEEPLPQGLDMLGELVSRAKSKGRGRESGRAGFAGFVHYPRTKPFIAAVDGPALAGGFELVLACDMVVASRSARFGLPEPRVGLFAAAGGAFRLPRLIPAARAMRMLLTGESMDAAEAERLGLVNEVVEQGETLQAALSLAAKIAKNAPYALKETFNLARAARQMHEGAFWEENERAFRRILTTLDSTEGPQAFLDKRDPEWKG